MRIDLIAPHEIGSRERLDWRRMQAAEPTVDIPALSPGWIRCAGLARPDARIAVVREGSGRIRGFLPVQIGPRGVVEPLGASLKLGGGLVGDPQTEWGASEWVRDVGAAGMPFEGVPDRQLEFARAARGGVTRLFADLQGGGAAYLRRRREEGVDLLDLYGRRAGALEAAGGPLRVKLFSDSAADFSSTLYWSAEGFRRPQEDWEIAALRLAFERADEDGGCAVLFTIHAGERLAAGACFLAGERSAQLAFYGEDPELAGCEPAAAVVADALSAFSARGVEEVDLGAVEGPVSREFATRRRQRLYGLVRPSERKPFVLPIPGFSRRGQLDWSRPGSAPT
jgi:CelD/BcsL family acetyltransferase involved in cellulose biosynthesis